MTRVRLFNLSEPEVEACELPHQIFCFCFPSNAPGFLIYLWPLPWAHLPNFGPSSKGLPPWGPILLTSEAHMLHACLGLSWAARRWIPMLLGVKALNSQNPCLGLLHPECQHGMEFGSEILRLCDQRRWRKLLRYNLLIRDKGNAN